MQQSICAMSINSRFLPAMTVKFNDKCKLHRMHFSIYSDHNSLPLFCYYYHPYGYQELYLCESPEHFRRCHCANIGIQPALFNLTSVKAHSILAHIITLFLVPSKGVWNFSSVKAQNTLVKSQSLAEQSLRSNIHLKSSTFWALLLCSSLKVNQCFRGTCHLNLHG